MPIRLRLPELFEAAGLTAYAVATASGGRLTLSTVYRLVRANGVRPTFDADVIEALCDVLHCEPCDLFERAPAPAKPRKSPTKPVKKARRG